MDVDKFKPGQFYLFGEEGHLRIAVGLEVRAGGLWLEYLRGAQFLADPSKVFPFDYGEDRNHISRGEDIHFRTHPNGSKLVKKIGKVTPFIALSFL